MKSLDPFNINLEKITLIEASAGTGKTYTITTLFCRLVAEGYSVESILVVTFTEAAAAELKMRIRARLFETLTDLSHKGEEDLNDLSQLFYADKERYLIRQRLENALNSFDQASIMTIHSFCFKILKEYAFESRTLFDIELIPDGAGFLQQIASDFFMMHVNDLDPLFLSYLKTKKVNPQNFIDNFKTIISRKNIIITPHSAEYREIFDQYRQTADKIYRMLLTGSAEIIELIMDYNGIDRRSYSRRNVPTWINACIKKFNREGGNTLFNMTENGDSLYKFTRRRIKQKIKPGYEILEHELFDLCEQLIEFNTIFQNNLISLKIKFLHFYNRELEKNKKQSGICFFDDLVNDLAEALEKKDSVYLLKCVRQNYKACLIDEFQDTDSKQYDIFSNFFASAGTPFFMIGDPKQAIYAFRGGDIFAYLKASGECDQKFTLKKNYRSAPLLVDGINAVFLHRLDPFLFKQIEFHPSSTPDTAVNYLTENGDPIPPLQFNFIKRNDNILQGRQKYISKSKAYEIIPEVVAKDIHSLLNSDKLLEDKELSRSITPEDIAVLVRTNSQALQIHNALSEWNIPSYLSTTGSVFDSDHAVELYAVLYAVYNPGSRGSIKSALCTSLFGFDNSAIRDLEKREQVLSKNLESWQEIFSEFKDIWRYKGAAAMIMSLFHCASAFADKNAALNERGMTNFYHLSELIFKADLKEKLTPYHLLKWYERQLNREKRDVSFDELRLETDNKAVAIVTIHKSKGLEYPVVYLPYLWEGKRESPEENVIFHDPEKEYTLSLDLGSENIDTAKQCYGIEDQAEQRRLLYVALTRASALCRIIWAGVNSVEASALGGILHDHGENRDDQAMTKDMEQLKACAAESISIETYQRGPRGFYIHQNSSIPSDLSEKPVNSTVKALWKTSSFSSIAHSSSNEYPGYPEENFESNFQSFSHENPGRDAKKKREDLSITLSDFEKGAGAGDLLHSIFEQIDFKFSSDDIRQVVKERFDGTGFKDSDMIHSVVKSIKEVLATALTAEECSFCLKTIKPQQRLNEMEFIFPVNAFKTGTIVKSFETSGERFKRSGYLSELSRLTTDSISGYIKGFIDLVINHQGKWYIVDYKSNYLGDTYGWYSQENMSDAMSKHHYFLQYYIYTVALHRYLTRRIKHYRYNTHFGGVFYLFIRGMHPQFRSEYGVFYDRPAESVISCLSDDLMGKN